MLLYALGDGAALTIVKNAGKDLWVDAPTIDVAEPRVYTGTVGGRSGAYAVDGATQVMSAGIHTFTPAATLIHVVNTNTAATSPAISADYIPRWHTHAGVVPA